MSIKKLFLSIFSISILLLVGLAFLIFQLYQTQKLLNQSHEIHYQSYLVAQELRQSSDDLTKFARTYVATGESKYEKMYWDILAIRNGEQPRPERYEGIYWDFVAYTNEKPRPDGQAIALKQRMKELGFTEQEFAKLSEAENNSNHLVNLEKIAMNAVKGLFSDGMGNFTVKKSPDLELARRILFDTEYHKEKYHIMKPLDDFFKLVTERTAMTVQQYELLNRVYILLILAFTGLIIVSSLIFYSLLTHNVMHQLGGEPAVVAEIANKIGQGDLSSAHFNVDKPLTGLFKSIQQMQNQLRERIERDKRITDEALRVKCALDSVVTSVMIADNQHKIIYLNNAAENLFKANETYIRTQLPHFNAHQLLNSEVSMFCPNQQQSLLDNLVDTHHSTLILGELTIDSTFTPVINLAKERLGTVIELRDRTLEITMVKEINAVVQAASQGDFKKRIRLDNKTGFFKTFSESVDQILAVNQEMIEDIMRMFAALAKGDLTQEIKSYYTGAFEQLKNDANATVKKLMEIITMIQQTAKTVNHAAHDISEGNISLSQRTEHQSASLEETSASIEQMTSSVQKNAENTNEASQLAAIARERAEQGGSIVNMTILAMDKISNSSKKVSEIIGLIDELAFQTNLLALNAAVEAARAGEQGRGFAVVAIEVRYLAQRSAAAAKEIKSLIKESVDNIEEGMELAAHSGKTLEEILSAVKDVSGRIIEIAGASKEQAAGINQVNDTILQMDEITRQNVVLVGQISATSEMMVEQAKHLKQQVAFFTLPH